MSRTPKDGVRYTRKTITLAVHYKGADKPKTEEVEAYTNGDWAYHQKLHGTLWTVTHLPTGLACGHHIWNRMEHARSLCSAIVKNVHRLPAEKFTMRVPPGGNFMRALGEIRNEWVRGLTNKK